MGKDKKHYKWGKYDDMFGHEEHYGPENDVGCPDKCPEYHDDKDMCPDYHDDYDKCPDHHHKKECPDECPPGKIIHYQIKAGDTFFKLARRFGTTVEAIMALNPGVDPRNLQIGQIIHIPCGIPHPLG